MVNLVMIYRIRVYLLMYFRRPEWRKSHFKKHQKKMVMFIISWTQKIVNQNFEYTVHDCLHSLSLKIIEQKWGVSSKRLRFSSPSLLCLIAFLHFSTVGDSSTNGKSSGGRQLVPGLLRLPDTNKYNGSAYRQNQGNQTLIWSTFIFPCHLRSWNV